MPLPPASEDYWQQRQQVIAAATAIAARSWDTSDGDSAKWLAVLPLMLRTVYRAQAVAALLGSKFIPTALAQQGIAVKPMASPTPAPLIGVSGAGLPLDALYAGMPDQFTEHAARILTRNRAAEAEADGIVGADLDQLLRAYRKQLDAAGALEVADPETRRQAMAAAREQLTASVQTAISDASRAAESLEIAVRPEVGYVRMLNPPSCPRCVILAGKFYKWNEGFQRHPRCDCNHIPVTEAAQDDVRLDPMRYFNSLDEQMQNDTFGKATAAAIRDGADISRVVNAYQGVRRAQVYGKNLWITTQGNTKRGAGGKAIRKRGRSPATTPRLMPSAIYEIAEDRTDALRLLRMNGYIAEPEQGVVDLDALLAAAS